MCKSGGYIVKSNHFIMNQLCISTHFNHITAHLGKISFRILVCRFFRKISFRISNRKSQMEISFGNLKSNFQLEISIPVFSSKISFRKPNPHLSQESHFENQISESYENLISKIKPENSAKISFRKSITQSQTDSTNLRDTQSSVLLHHHSFSPCLASFLLSCRRFPFSISIRRSICYLNLCFQQILYSVTL